MFKTGDFVRVMPHSDLFMMGETRATVVSVGSKWITVEGQRSGRKFKFHRDTDCLEAA